MESFSGLHCLSGYIMYTIKNIAKSKDEVSWHCGKHNCVMKYADELKTRVHWTNVTGARLVREHSHPADETRVWKNAAIQ